MEKILLKQKDDVQKAIDYFGKKYGANIQACIRSFPCILIGSYADDIEFGSNYTFTTVVLDDFEQESGKVSYQ